MTAEPKPRLLTKPEIVRNLRSLANFLEDQNADYPLPFALHGTRSPQTFRCYVYGKEQLRAVARALGTFKKRYTDQYFELVVEVNTTLEIVFYCDRSLVCKSRVVFDCEDAESILRDLTAEKSPEAVVISAPPETLTAEDVIPF